MACELAASSIELAARCRARDTNEALVEFFGDGSRVFVRRGEGDLLPGPVEEYADRERPTRDGLEHALSLAQTEEMLMALGAEAEDMGGFPDPVHRSLEKARAVAQGNKQRKREKAAHMRCFLR